MELRGFGFEERERLKRIEMLNPEIYSKFIKRFKTKEIRKITQTWWKISKRSREKIL
jgi:hypothetical protein